MIVVTPKLTDGLQDELEAVEGEGLKKRMEMERISKRFFINCKGIVTALYLYAKQKFEKPGLYIIKYLWNGGSTFLSSLGKLAMTMKKASPPIATYFLMDEVQTLADDLEVPRRNGNDIGSKITLFTWVLRRLGPVILTTTYVKSVQSQLETLISQDNYKRQEICFSYDFDQPLPILHSRDVQDFLSLFINIENGPIWLLVSYFVQGPFRRAEFFLQELFKTLKNLQNQEMPKCEELIYSVLNSVVNSKGTNIALESKLGNDITKALFYKLALLGEVKTQDTKGFSKFLLTNSISHTFDYTKNIFQIVSPIEQRNLLDCIRNAAEVEDKDWFNFACEEMLHDIKNKPMLTEVLAVYALLEHFNIITSDLERSYLKEYEFLARYYCKDAQISKTSNKWVEIRISSLMLLAIQNNSFPLNNNDNTLTKCCRYC